MAFLEKTRSRSRIKKVKKQIARKAKFREQSNPLKTYKPLHTPEEVSKFAAHCRRQRLLNPTMAEQAMADILDRVGEPYEREKIFYRAKNTRFVLADFFLRDHKIVFEIDGLVHTRQKGHDLGRDRYFNQIGIRVFRFENQDILQNKKEIEIKVRGLLG